MTRPISVQNTVRLHAYIRTPCSRYSLMAASITFYCRLPDVNEELLMQHTDATKLTRVLSKPVHNKYIKLGYEV